MTFLLIRHTNLGFSKSILEDYFHKQSLFITNPLLVFEQNGYLGLHFDVVKCRVVVTRQVVSVVVIVNRLVVLWIISKFLHVWIQLEHLALVRDRLHVVFILVWWLEESALFRGKVNVRMISLSINSSRDSPDTWDLDILEFLQGGRTTWHAQP